MIDAGFEIDKYDSSSQSKSKYIILASGLKIRLSEHNLPPTYENSDIDFRYGDDILELVKRVGKIENE